ncbi:MAG TPA: DUF1893 domain-containing protein [Firmicutes bacterium]|nr:DUF1893 domain-containing protein [Candidatus Fermentithermobacillaceae bacterium]
MKQAEDLRLAKEAIQQGWSACLARRGKIIDKEQGIRLQPVLGILKRQVEKYGDLTGLQSSLAAEGYYAFADKVIGLAAFRLAYLLGARAMWGELCSSLALEEARKRGVQLEYDNLVPAIMNQTQDDLCPMERMASEIASDLEFYSKLTSRGR